MGPGTEPEVELLQGDVKTINVFKSKIRLSLKSPNNISYFAINDLFNFLDNYNLYSTNKNDDLCGLFHTAY